MSKNRNCKLVRFAQMFKALSHPNRLSIFLHLASCCRSKATCCVDRDMRRCVGQLGKDLGIVASTVSHHIKELHRAGLIQMARRGQTIECWVDPETLRDLEGFFGQAGALRQARAQSSKSVG